ncbi:hypothetical protein skT53_14570 [Effusibacillus dendaii]|uniref:Uncharacterized protein n=1 Tax=Effusibacillus dendaii TaxID=2743772 RepID=A0A7I8DAU8_9BACL|nr:hypothetical protein skT53_14570 [Effusibacillus dendaii]
MRYRESKENSGKTNGYNNCIKKSGEGEDDMIRLLFGAATVIWVFCAMVEINRPERNLWRVAGDTGMALICAGLMLG